MSFFETVKCTLKIRIYDYANDKSCTDFSLKMHQKRSHWGAYSDPPDLQARFKSGGRDKGRRKRKREEGIDS